MLLGFDIGGTKCAVVIGESNVNGDITIIDKIRLQTHPPTYAMIGSLFDQAEELLLRHHMGIDDIDGIGISCGGPLSSKKGMILSPPNLVEWVDIPIVELTQKRFGKKVCLQNDANAGVSPNGSMAQEKAITI